MAKDNKHSNNHSKKFVYKEKFYDKLDYHAANVAAAGAAVLGAAHMLSPKASGGSRLVGGAIAGTVAYGLHHEAKQRRKDVENRERLNYELRRKQS